MYGASFPWSPYRGQGNPASRRHPQAACAWDLGSPGAGPGGVPSSLHHVKWQRGSLWGCPRGPGPPVNLQEAGISGASAWLLLWVKEPDVLFRRSDCSVAFLVLGGRDH